MAILLRGLIERAWINMTITLAACSLLLCSCGEASHSVEPMRVIAAIGGSALRVSDIESAIPHGLSSKDSTDFVALYAQRWVLNELKQREAERIFSTSARDVEALVSSYRSSLLSRKLDQYYLSNATPPEISDEEIRRYYNLNYSEFPLEENIVKGRILRVPSDHASSGSLTTLMKSNTTEKNIDLTSICEKDNSLMLSEFLTEWVTYDSFIEMLPLVHDSNSDSYIKRNGVQSLNSEHYLYLFEITAYRTRGKATPLEIASPTIRRVLTNKALKEMLHREEERLLESAQEKGLVRNYTTQQEREE